LFCNNKEKEILIFLPLWGTKQISKEEKKCSRREHRLKFKSLVRFLLINIENLYTYKYFHLYYERNNTTKKKTTISR
jgi:hypothetical protein